MAGAVERGEVRLYRFPVPDKERPVLVLTRNVMVAHLSRVTVAPLTSTLRGVPSEVILGIDDGLRHHCAVNLHNVVTVPKQGLGRRLAKLGPGRMREVCVALGFALGCDQTSPED